MAKQARRVRGVGHLVPKGAVVDFIKRGDGFLYLNWYKDGDAVQLTERQAKYPLLQGVIVRKPVVAKPAEA